jgi:hypothetical protein
MCKLCTIHIKIKRHGFSAKLAETNIRRESLGQHRASGKRLTPEEWLWLEQNYIGKVIDREVAKIAQEKFDVKITKAAVERYRSKRKIKSYMFSEQIAQRKTIEKEMSEAQKRGYPSLTIEKLWLETRFIQELFLTWKRTPELRKEINNLDKWRLAQRIWRA